MPRENCPVCGRPWRPHYGPKQRSQIWWHNADWFHEICGACGGLFKRWLNRVRFNDDSEVDKDFLVWVLKKYREDIGRLESHGKLYAYCKGESGKDWCRFKVIKDGYCSHHYQKTDEELATEAEERRKSEEKHQNQVLQNFCKRTGIDLKDDYWLWLTKISSFYNGLEKEDEEMLIAKYGSSELKADQALYLQDFRAWFQKNADQYQIPWKQWDFWMNTFQEYAHEFTVVGMRCNIEDEREQKFQRYHSPPGYPP